MPFIPMGNWRPAEALPSVDLSVQSEDLGIQFLTRALCRLGFKLSTQTGYVEIEEAPAEIRTEDLAAAVNEVYASDSLYVAKADDSLEQREIDRRNAEKGRAA